MLFTRRRFLRVSLGAGLLAPLGVGCTDAIQRLPSKPDQWQTLRAYLDTLIPEDESPSATQVGVTEKIISHMEANAGYRQFITKGCAWLDAQAKQYDAVHFAALSDAQREQVMSWAATGKATVFAQMFFDRTQADTFSFYYAHPRSWRALGYAGPPQPRGFMDYTQPPTRRSS